MPMMVRLTSPVVVDGTFMLRYDTDCFKITTDAAGNNVVSDTTQFTASALAAPSFTSGASPDLRPERLADYAWYRDPYPLPTRMWSSRRPNVSLARP